MATNNELKLRDGITDLKRPNEVLELANMLANVILRKGLSVRIKGSSKQYVMVEGWQLAGAMCGIYPVVEKVENLSDEKRICYRAEVTLRDQNDKVVGTGMAICTNQERGKEKFAEYAICSMAQTRAVGKALRLKLGWIIKLAGFQPTPAEEIKSGGEAIEGDVEEAEAVEIDYAEELKKASSMNELYQAWIKIPKKQQVEYVELKEELKAQFADVEESK